MITQAYVMFKILNIIMILHELSFNINFYETHLGQVKRAFGRQVSLVFIVNLQ